MGKKHRLAERRQQILMALEAAGELSVFDLSVRFDVSEVTIRQDLQALSEQGLLLRTRGKALATTTMPELSFDVRQQQQAAQKIRIGQAAAQMIYPGNTIILDASTTAQATIPHLKKISDLTVVTNSLKAAMSLLDAPHIHVIIVGHYLRRESISLIGQVENDMLKNINAQIGFFGAHGVTVEAGLTDVNMQEVMMKKIMVERCRQVVGVVDARKWGKEGTSTFADTTCVKRIISDTKAPADMVASMRQQQVEVILV